MDSQNQKNIHLTSDQSVDQNLQICPNCSQTYLFDVQCPTCKARISQDTEKLLLAVHIKNMMDYTGMGDLFECDYEDLKQLDNIVTKLFKQKEPKHG